MSDATEHDEDCNGEDPTARYAYGSLQAYDLIAIGLRVAGGCAHTIGQGFHMLANEFLYAARHRRELEEALLARAEADESLRRWVAMDDGPMTTRESDS